MTAKDVAAWVIISLMILPTIFVTVYGVGEMINSVIKNRQIHKK